MEKYRKEFDLGNNGVKLLVRAIDKDWELNKYVLK